MIGEGRRGDARLGFRLGFISKRIFLEHFWVAQIKQMFSAECSINELQQAYDMPATGDSDGGQQGGSVPQAQGG